MLSTDELVRRLRREVAGRTGSPSDVLMHDQPLAAQPPIFDVLRPRLPAALGQALVTLGVKQLYRHQVEAIQAARAHQNVVIRTPTSSGKTLAFSLPTLERILERRAARALYIYPTKALLNDQLRSLSELLATVETPGASLRVDRLSGDVSAADRADLQRDLPEILLANPDILHHELLPRHRRWAALLTNLDVVVIDELHTGRGVFGSHVALILRRLRRLAARYGSSPIFLAASATIANPEGLAEALVGLPFTTIAGDAGGGVAARRMLLWRPPARGRKELNKHASTPTEAVTLFAELIRCGRTVILFGKSRAMVEAMLIQARELLGPELALLVSAYKGGYTPGERRRIEEALREGRLRGVVTTNALELGIDVGALDACVLAGWPGSVMSLWQQAGRVGRRTGRDAAIIIFVASDDALDAYYVNHPQTFFGAPTEQAVVDPGNESILLGHLLCAAKEAPLEPEELELFPVGAERLVGRLAAEGLLSGAAPWSYAGDEWPHARVSIRGIGRSQYTLKVAGHAGDIGTIEPPLLYREAYVGALYPQNGQVYRVERIDEASKEVCLRPSPGGGRTDPLPDISVAPRGHPAQTRELHLGSVAATVSIGPITAREAIGAYREKAPGSWRTMQKLVEPPHVTLMETVGIWVDIPSELHALPDALHALEHALVNALPLQLLCDRRDVGSTFDSSASAGGRVYLYDDCEGGVGLAEKAYGLVERLVAGATELLAECRCRDGCPSCVHLPGCGRGNADLGKARGLALLRGEAVAVAAQPRGPVQQRLTAEKQEDLGAKMRRIADEGLRERLHALGGVGPGDVLELPGEGRVTVIEIKGPKAKVRYVGYRTWTWVAVDSLRRI